MRYPEGHKEETRARIVEAASRALRREGLAGVSVPALMKRAGLTHGGFYGHFRDRDALVCEAVAFAAGETAEALFERAPDLASAVEVYLSQAHLDHPERGCVLAALGSEARQQPAPVRAAFAKAARGFIEGVARRLGGKPSPTDEALALASRLVGALVLARLVDDPHLAGRLLEAARRP